LSGLLTFFVVVTRGNKMNGREKEREREAPGFDVDDQYQRVERCVQTRRALEKMCFLLPSLYLFPLRPFRRIISRWTEAKGGETANLKGKKKVLFCSLAFSLCLLKI
jgi:hypothetical protein